MNEPSDRPNIIYRRRSANSLYNKADNEISDESQVNASKATLDKEDTEEKNGVKFSSSSSSFTSAKSAKYKSIEKIVTKNKEFFTVPNNNQISSPPPPPRSAAPPLINRQNAVASNDDDCSEKATSQDEVDSASASTQRAHGDESTAGTNSPIVREKKLTGAVEGNNGEDEPNRVKNLHHGALVGRHSRHASGGRRNRVAPTALNSVMPYIPRRDMFYTTYQRYPPQALGPQPGIYSPNQTKSNIPCKVQMFQFLEVAIKRILFHLAKSAIQYQFVFQILPLLLTFLPLFALWIIRGYLNFNTPPFDTFLSDLRNTQDGTFDANLYHKQFTAISGLPIVEFNHSNPMFDALRRTSPYEFSIILSTSSGNDNILSNSSLNVYHQLFAQIRNITITHSQIRLEWKDMCRENCGEEVHKVISAIQKRQLLLKYPEAILLHTLSETNENGSSSASILTNVNRVFLANVLGDVELDMDGVVSRAHSLLLNIKLKESLKPYVLLNFERQLCNILKNFSALQNTSDETEGMNVNMWSYRNYVSEVMCYLKETHIKIIGCFIVFAISTFIFIGFAHCSPYKSRPFVAIHIVFLVVLVAILSYALHLLGASGHVLNYTLYPIIFILCGMAILIFATVAESFSRYSLVAFHPAEKLAFIYSWDLPAFVCIVLSIAGSSVATAYIAENMLMRQMFLSMAAGLTALLLFGIFYLTIFWYAAEKREASGLKWFQFCRMGDESFNNKHLLDYDELICDRLHEKLTDLRPNLARRIGALASNAHMRTLCTIIYTAFFIYMGAGLLRECRCVQMREEFFVVKNASIFSSDAYLKKFNEAYEHYEDYIELIFQLPVDYYNKRNKERIFELLRWPLDNQYATRAVSWLIDFERFQKSTIFEVNSETIVPVINYIFLKSDAYQKYETDIVFDRFQTQILKSRMYLELSAKGLTSSETLLKELEKRAQEANLPVTFHAPYTFLLRHDRKVLSIVLSAFAWLTAFLTLTCIIFFTYAIIWLCAPISSLLTSIAACGTMQTTLFAVPFNIITLSTILIGNLFSTAVTIYFCYSFNNADHSQNSNLKRMKYAFQCTFLPTAFACITPVLIYLPLLIGTTTSIVIHIFKVLIIVSLVTFFNYLLFLPSLTIILTDYISCCFNSLNNFCDGNVCCAAVEQPAESAYFVPRGPAGGMAAISGVSGARSIASYYSAPHYLMNEALALPPAYDYRQHMITAGDALDTEQPSAPPPLPPLPSGSGSNSASNSGRRSLCASSTNNTKELCAEQLSSSYPHAYRNSPLQKHASPSSIQSPRSPRQRLANSGSAFPMHRYAPKETTSNFDSFDSQHDNRQLKNNDGTSAVGRTFSISPSASPRAIATNDVKRRHANGLQTSNGVEQIYEEPESPIVLRPRRSHSDGRRRNAIFDSGDAIQNTQMIPTKSSFSPHALRREIVEHVNSSTSYGVNSTKFGGVMSQCSSKTDHNRQIMQPNWRQYFIDGHATPRNQQNQQFASCSPQEPRNGHMESHRRRYRF